MRFERYLNEDESTFNVTLNWKGELHKYTNIKASSETQAKEKCVSALALKLNRTRSSVSVEFRGSKDNAKVEKVG